MCIFLDDSDQADGILTVMDLGNMRADMAH